MLNSTTASAVLKHKIYQRPRYALGSSMVLCFAAFFLTLCLIVPLLILLQSAFLDENQQFIGLENFKIYFSNPALISSIFHSLSIALSATLITVILASIYAFALINTQMKAKAFFKTVAFLPILAPAILPALALIYLFGQQGVFKDLLGSLEIYGPLGILISYCFWLFPAMVMLMSTAFRNIDQRLIEAAYALGKTPWQTQFVVILPAIRYGLISACLVAFTYVITDFSIPKVIGGSFNMMALDVYKQIIGQQNISMGAVISILLLCPALLAFMIDRYQRHRQQHTQSSQTQPYYIAKNHKLETLFTVFCSIVATAILLIIITAFLASFIRYWPYDLSLTFSHYRFDYVDGGGWPSYFNSLKLAFWTSIIGTSMIFIIALFTTRFKAHPLLKNYVQMLALLPLAVPGLVLGIGYILFFNQPENPLSILYGGMTLLVLSTIIHYYSVPHLTFSHAIQQIPDQLDHAAQSLNISHWNMLRKVYFPLTLPALCDVSVYLFVNAMTTVSAAIFLYSPETSLASIAVLNMDDAGDTVAAVAMSILILATSCGIKLLHWCLTRKMLQSSQRWREPYH
ncbi:MULTISPECIES: putative 2-aminoethylphosphonate ABC transporter permease subunit [unclassified Acinetobacter]|uniref:putative 2-aminoethylphosphonate ABC transporter permease subunit n=1 Tax=unclassified Acinetobacter TaxID=196816 RepID=UPI0029347D60|nr:MULTISPECIES: putative 2-aminoethylphosphonate ABC transporter permease subunit [unclassified Acinetobacter]WOE33325.1 putative 2-aminoethylphosphonate ABC transporter permease subunit [Acinetobacter sp. SAAs470]WOE37016.1 putative 2-aminoethylphosphonate ABC transporter permease subunit [Acinetobacter sp. SAAs474]